MVTFRHLPPPSPQRHSQRQNALKRRALTDLALLLEGGGGGSSGDGSGSGSDGDGSGGERRRARSRGRSGGRSASGVPPGRYRKAQEDRRYGT